MVHHLSLCHSPFLSIKENRKSIEMRLYDEKRQNIKIGDILEFIDLDTKEIINVEVIDIKLYPSFKELYLDNDKISLGYSNDEEANYLDMLTYYPKERQEKYQAMAIHIKKL